MKKENLLYLIIILLVFISGFLIGDKMNENDRYKFRTTDYGYTLYDSKEGLIYNYENERFTKYDIINGNTEKYKGKK